MEVLILCLGLVDSSLRMEASPCIIWESRVVVPCACGDVHGAGGRIGVQCNLHIRISGPDFSWFIDFMILDSDILSAPFPHVGLCKHLIYT